MKKSTIIQTGIIIVLAIILGILVKFTIEAINENSMPQIANQGMNGQGGNMPGQMGENAGSIEYSGVTQITEDTTIESGNINITSTDDSIHSNGIIVIDGGTLNLSSGDDGIHADTNIVINGGNIDVSKSYEGIESAYIEINGGTISVIASDDGINISGGNDSSSMGERPGQNSFSNIGTTNQKLVINNGNISVNATGDGLDANGSIYINGGTVLVKGPTNSGNGALDYDTSCEFNGGDIIIYGSTGMWQDATSGSTQYTLTFKTSGNSGDNLVLKDGSGNEISSISTEKYYGAITISNSKIEKGETYTLYKNNSSVGSITVSSIINSLSNSSYMNGGGMNGKHKGGF